MSDQPVQYKYKQLFHWNIGDDAYKPSIAVYGDGMVEIVVGGYGIGTSIEKIFDAMHDQQKSPCPFCGVVPVHTCQCKAYAFLSACFNFVDDSWNSAWCWKAIDRLNVELKESNDRLFESRDNLKTALEVNEEIKADNEKLKEAIRAKDEALKYYAKPAFCQACMLPVERGDTAKEALKIGEGEK